VLDGEYANLSNRKELWYLLLTVSRNKSRDFRRRANRRAVREASVSNQAEFIRLVELVDQKTESAEWLAIMDEQCEMLLQKLDEQDPTGVLRKIALMRLDGESKSRIAEKFGHTRRTVVARLTLIQAIWNSYLDNHDD
jgi:DNA-directed RNA polymerase specialized sigma24 family protein